MKPINRYHTRILSVIVLACVGIWGIFLGSLERVVGSAALVLALVCGYALYSNERRRLNEQKKQEESNGHR